VKHICPNCGDGYLTERDLERHKAYHCPNSTSKSRYYTQMSPLQDYSMQLMDGDGMRVIAQFTSVRLAERVKDMLNSGVL